MSKSTLGVVVSTAFAVALTFTGIPERWKTLIVVAAWSVVVLAAIAWFRAHRREAKSNTAPQSVTLKAIAEQHAHRRAPQLNSPSAMVERQETLVKIRDLVVSTRSKPTPERFDEMGALIKFSNEFKNEKQVDWTLAELEQRQFQNPFKILENAAPGVFDDRKLEFLTDARTATIEIRRITSALSFAVKYWRHAEEYKKAHRDVMGWDETEEGIQAATATPAFSPGKTNQESRAMFLAIVDKLKAGVKPLRALQEVKADELDTNEMLIELCDDLVKFGHPHPFQSVKGIIQQDKWLGVLVGARYRGLDLSDELELLDLLATEFPEIKPPS